MQNVNYLSTYRKYDNPMNNDKIRNQKDESTTENKLLRPHTSRNKLGTVFNEKVVVSPVPYVLSTRESFSTVKTTPIKFMAQSLEVSSFQGMSYFFLILCITYGMLKIFLALCVNIILY